MPGMRSSERVPPGSHTPAAPGAASLQRSRAVHKGKHVSILNSDPRPLAAFWSADVLEMSPQSSVLKRLEPFQLANDRGQSQMLL